MIPRNSSVRPVQGAIPSFHFEIARGRGFFYLSRALQGAPRPRKGQKSTSENNRKFTNLLSA